MANSTVACTGRTTAFPDGEGGRVNGVRRGEEVILHAVKGERGGDGEVGWHHYVCNVSRIYMESFLVP